MATLFRSVAVVLLAAVAALGFVFPAISSAADGPHSPPIAVADVSHPGPVDFEKEILPVFSASCLACHNKTKPKAGLVLETPADIRKGGDDGLVIKPGKGAESLLIKAASHAPEEDSPMPPPNNKVAARDLTPQQLGLIKLWIDQGATGEVHGTAIAMKWRAMPAVLDPIYAASVSPDGRYAAAGRANRIDVYDLSANKLAAHLVDPALTASGSDAAHRDMVESLTFSPDGTTLASGSYREVKLWKRSSEGEKIALGDKPATCAAASANGKWIATAGEDGTIHLWDADGKPAGELTGHTAPLIGLQFSADGAKLLSVSKDKSVRIFDVQGHKAFCKVEPPGEVRCAAWLGGRTIAVGANDGAITLYTLPGAADGEMTAAKPLKDAATPITSIAALPGDEAHLLIARDDGVFRVSIGSNNIRPLLKHGAPITALAIRADGKRIVTAGTDNIARIWTIDDGKKIAELKGDPILAARAVTADRALNLAKSEVTYRKGKIDANAAQVKSSADRISRAKDALPVAEKALADAQKAFDAAKAASEAADKASADKKEKLAKDLTSADDDLKKAKEAKTTTVERAQKTKDALASAERELASAQKAFDAAKTAKEAAAAKSEAKKDASSGTDDEKKAAAAKADEAKSAAEKEFAKADEKLKKAKDAQTAAMEASQQAKDAAGGAEKTLASAQKAFETAKAANDAFANARDDKKENAAKELTKADDDLKKSKNAKNAADDEIKLSARAAEDYGVALAAAKTAEDAAEKRLKVCEQDAADAKKAIGDSARPIRAVAFSPDGALIATAGDDGAVHTWSSEKGTAGEVVGHEAGAITAVAFVAADHIVLCPAGAPPAIVHPSSMWKLARTIGNADSTSPFADRVTSLDFSPDGHWLVTGGGVPSRSGEIRLFDAETGTLKQAFDDVHSDTVFCVRFSPDGTRLASAGADRFVRILDLTTGKVLRSLEGHGGHALSVAWSHDGHTLVSGGADNTLRFWDAETGERGKVVAGYDKEVTAVTFVGDEMQAASTSGDARVRLIKADGGDVRSYSGPTDFMYTLCATPDGTTLVAGGQDGVLRVWNAATGAPTETFDANGKK
ncbi:MAG TPA: c-type cytochrome domain-containing protein [Tepidisphaeraceae bacterium]|jgi:WD40 repeat protein|nr:c-type cytochrome domain-containing protein [Tepidisphaeraceae bacterium]